MAGIVCGRALIHRPALPSVSVYGSPSVRRGFGSGCTTFLQLVHLHKPKPRCDGLTNSKPEHFKYAESTPQPGVRLLPVKNSRWCHGKRLGGKSLRKYEPTLGVYDLSHLSKSLDARAEVSYVSPEDARKLVTEQGYTILDVRDKTQYERAHIKSCYHVPLFIKNNDNDFGTIVSRTLHNNFAGLIFGLSFTKPNSEFVSMVQQKFPTDTKLLLVCQEGLRSVAAARKLEAAGYQNLSCITSGLQSVKPGTFDKEGSKELQDAGKAGLVTVQGKISAVLGTILVVAYLFLTFFPDQAEQLFEINVGLESSL